jgi:hypothetical protein
MAMAENKTAGFFLRWLTARSESPLTAALLLCLALSVFAATPGRAASFTAALDRDTISLGEQATLSLAFEGGQSKKVPTPRVPGLQIVQTGTSQNVSIINGAMSSTVTVTFSVNPQQTGEFTIPAMTADVNGQTLTSQPLKLTVLKASAPPAAVINSGSEVAFLKLVLPKQQVHVGEALAGQLLLCLRDDVQNYGNFRLTSTPAEGFSIGKFAEGPHRQQQVGNRTYTIIPVSVALTATKTGSLSLGPFTANVVVVLPSSNQGGDPFFQFFNQGQQKQVPLATEQITVQSLPLPAENVPTNFSGAIGNYTLDATAGPTNVAVGDPITMHVQIAGQGNLDTIKSPIPAHWTNFKLFPPTSKLETSDQLGLEGTRTFEEIVTPDNTDARELPSLAFSFFNPDDGKYHTLTQPAVPLTVRSAGSTPLPTLAANKNSGENQAPQDILPIKETLGTLVAPGAPLITRPAFLAAQTLPVLAFLAALVWRKRADSLANNPRLRRQRAVAALMASGMDDLKKYAAANQPDEFFATLFRLLQEQLGERLDCPASAITENVIEEHPVLRGAPKATLDALREQFQLCNQARYAPVRGTSELNTVAAQFEKLIGQLREVKG